MDTQILIGFITVVVTIVGLIMVAHRYNTNQRIRIYERLDSVKDQHTSLLEKTKDRILKKTEEEYARKDICRITHRQIDEKLEGILKQTSLIPSIIVKLETLVNERKCNDNN